MRKLKASARNWHVAILVVVASLMSASCGGSPKGSQQSAVANAAGLVFNTASLDFGAVAVDDSRKASVVVTNSSAANGGSVTVSKMVVTGSGFALSAPLAGFTLTPGQSSTITVNFAPKAAGEATGQLSIFVAGASASSEVALTGSTIVGSQLVLFPSKLNFGGVALGASKTLTGTLSAGSTDVVVASASWNGQGYSVSGIDFPVTVPANTSISYKVSFAPQASGSISGGIIFVSDAPNSPATQTFTGSGGAVSQVVHHSVDLSCDLGSAGIDCYNVYRGKVSGGPYTKLNSTALATSSYTDATVKSGTTYYYVATSVDAGVESAYSEEVVAAIPSP